MALTVDVTIPGFWSAFLVQQPLFQAVCLFLIGANIVEYFHQQAMMVSMGG